MNERNIGETQMSHYEGDYIEINGHSVHYKTLVMYVQHIHSHQDIDKNDTGSIAGWDLVRSDLHGYVFKTIDEDVDDEWKKQFDVFVENLFICKYCKKVPAYFDWYCKACDEFVSLGDVMSRLEKYRIEHLVRY
jgi:hypothetical protein